MKISRIKLERVTTSLAVTLLAFMVVVMTLTVANYTFNWDLFPDELEKVGGVVMFSVFFVILASVVVNIMINIGRIADEFENRRK